MCNKTSAGVLPEKRRTVFFFRNQHTKTLVSLSRTDDDFALFPLAAAGDSSGDSGEFPAAAAAPDTRHQLVLYH